mmetsp:Transcript_6015/g.9322  ORF Transcript_6015/g.9322 Transcript_6015/m.9322 type:complete len:113 (-) Transcript_6015:183-521(-)
MGYLAANDVPSIHLRWELMQEQQEMLLPLQSVVYAGGLLFAEEFPADYSPFAFVDRVGIDQRVEFDHLVETLVAAASAYVDLAVASQSFASGVAFVMDFESLASAAGVAVAH